MSFVCQTVVESLVCLTRRRRRSVEGADSGSVEGTSVVTRTQGTPDGESEAPEERGRESVLSAVSLSSVFGLKDRDRNDRNRRVSNDYQDCVNGLDEAPWDSGPPGGRH